MDQLGLQWRVVFPSLKPRQWEGSIQPWRTVYQREPVKC